MSSEHRDRWILLIGIVKAIKSAALFALAVLALVLTHGDVATRLRHWAFVLGIDPGNHWIHAAIERANFLDASKLVLIAAALALYAILFAIEATGLLLQKRWGEYVTIVITGSFIPIEIYETVRHPHVGRALTIVLNVAAVAYLVHKVRRGSSRRAESARRPGGPAVRDEDAPPHERPAPPGRSRLDARVLR